VTRAFFIVGPTATGKSELAADVAVKIGGELIGADAFQIYRGLALLTAKPEAATLRKVPHHLIGKVSLDQEMNAEKFRTAALEAIAEVGSSGRLPIVVGGSGLYVKALTHGLLAMPASNQKLRDELNDLSLNQLRARLVQLDPEAAAKIDVKNRRRLVRALEICLLTGQPASAQRQQWQPVAAPNAFGAGSSLPLRTAASTGTAATGVFVFRDRAELYERINRRVEAMFENGVIEEVRAVGPISSTAAKTIGFREIRSLLDGKMSMGQCIAEIQQSTRHYAKRQLTWFRRQTSFEPLNLSLLSHGEAVEWITQLAKAFGVRVQG
jgi:tRNA dimethylallyltransferase